MAGMTFCRTKFLVFRRVAIVANLNTSTDFVVHLFGACTSETNIRRLSIAAVMSKRLSLVDKTNLYIVILADGNLPATGKVIAGWLLFNHHNTLTGICTPSNRTVGNAVGIRPENVSRHIHMLVKAGYLIARRRVGTSNSYDFDWSKGHKNAVADLRKRLKRPNTTAEDMTETTIANDENVTASCSDHQDGIDKNINLIRERKTVLKDGNLTLSGEIEAPLSLNEGEGEVIDPPDIESELDSGSDGLVARFSSIYPLIISQDDTPALRAALRRALTIASFDAILDGAMRYASECSDREAKFIANPINWLNGRRWCSTPKTKSDVVILGQDDNSLGLNHSRPLSPRQEILRWKASRKVPFSLQQITNREES